MPAVTVQRMEHSDRFMRSPGGSRMIQFPQSTNGHARSMSNEFKRHVPESTLRKYRENGKLPALKNGPEDFPVWLLAMAAIRGGLSARTVRAALDAITHIATDRARVGNDEFDRRWRQYLEDGGAETPDPFSGISLIDKWG